MNMERGRELSSGNLLPLDEANEVVVANFLHDLDLFIESGGEWLPGDKGLLIPPAITLDGHDEEMDTVVRSTAISRLNEKFNVDMESDLEMSEAEWHEKAVVMFVQPWMKSLLGMADPDHVAGVLVASGAVQRTSLLTINDAREYYLHDFEVPQVVKGKTASTKRLLFIGSTAAKIGHSEEDASLVSPEYSEVSHRIIDQFRDFVEGKRDEVPEAILQYDAYSDAEEAGRDEFMRQLSKYLGTDVEEALNQSEQEWLNGDERLIHITPWMKDAMGMPDPEQPYRLVHDQNISRDVALKTDERGRTHVLREIEFPSSRLDENDEPQPSMSRVIYFDVVYPRAPKNRRADVFMF